MINLRRLCHCRSLSALAEAKASCSLGPASQLIRSLEPGCSPGSSSDHYHTSFRLVRRELDRLWPQAAQACSRGLGFASRHLSAEQCGTEAEISEHDFYHLADHVLEELNEQFEAYVEQLDDEDCEVELGQGVLNLRLGKLGVYVINKQTPNRQIWLSSPVSGPFRYDYAGGSWVYKRDGHHMLNKLQEELSKLLNTEVTLQLPT